MAENWKVLWAKTEPMYPLWKHLLDAAAVSLALGSPLEAYGWNTNVTAFLVGLHDIGKSDAAFQYQAPQEYRSVLSDGGFAETADTLCRHERLSADFIKSRLSEVGMDAALLNAVVKTLAAHHGHWDSTRPRPVASAYQEAQQELLWMLSQALGCLQFPNERPANLSAFGMLLTGHIVLCDWIASNERFFTNPRLMATSEPSEHLEEAKQVAAEMAQELGLDGQDRSRDVDNPGNEVSDLANKVVAEPRAIQQFLLETKIPAGLVIIEAPMGEGKTEAAWILAEKWRREGYAGMYMALPTMATSDSLYERYSRDYLGRLHPGERGRLVHGMAWLRDEAEPELMPQVDSETDDLALAASWFRPTRRAMLSRHGVGTIDQAMLAGMHVKFGFLRLYGLRNKVLVIDEVHAYDAYMSAIINRLLEWCAALRIPVVLLSATLSSPQRAGMLEAYGATGGDKGPEAEYPLVTIAEPGRAVKAVSTEATFSRSLHICRHGGLLDDADGTANLAESMISDGGCCCVILNTVRQAQHVYASLSLPAEEKMLFHARFTAEDREQLTRRVLGYFGKDTSGRPERFVLVATQVVEQSLDVDFDYMISQVAPMDLLLQRSGRMHRHRKRESEPVLHVLLPEAECLDFGGTGYVYAQKPLLRTIALLDTTAVVHLPDDFRQLIERCYGTDEWQQTAIPWDQIHEADREWDADTQVRRHQGMQYTLESPRPKRYKPVQNTPVGDADDDGNGWRAKTRLGANDKTAVLVKGEKAEMLAEGEMPMGAVRALYRKALKLPSWLKLYSPSEGYQPALEGKRKIRGLIILPVDDNSTWQGTDERGNRYEISYDHTLGLRAGRKE